jgi:hypothetical protein
MDDTRRSTIAEGQPLGAPQAAGFAAAPPDSVDVAAALAFFGAAAAVQVQVARIVQEHRAQHPEFQRAEAEVCAAISSIATAGVTDAINQQTEVIIEAIQEALEPVKASLLRIESKIDALYAGRTDGHNAQSLATNLQAHDDQDQSSGRSG